MRPRSVVTRQAGLAAALAAAAALAVAGLGIPSSRSEDGRAGVKAKHRAPSEHSGRARSASKTGGSDEAPAEKPGAKPTDVPGWRPGTTPAPLPAAASSATPDEGNGGRIERCGPAIIRTTGGIVAAHAALSRWSKAEPDRHMVQSIIGLDYPNTAAPKAAAVLVAAPDAKGCETTLVEIHPTGRACAEIEADLGKTDVNPRRLEGMPVSENGTQQRMLIPVPGAGCVVVGVALALNP